ncbi:MAG: lipopolysaccharide kinase InaA family protein [Gemmatimonadaceae bacterium]
MARAEPPAGFIQFSIGRANVVCAQHIADATRSALSAGTLYDYAARNPNARSLAGRGVAYAVPLPGNVEQVVIRHNRHGGLLAGLTRDVFRSPTRAPYELETSLRLARAGVPSAPVLGYATYDVAPGFCRADVISREIVASADLSHALLSANAPTRMRALTATADLIARLSDAGARHHDLNVKNVLLRENDGGVEALVLDVDRVTFGETSRAALEHNLTRMLRSARKWQTRYGARVTDAELDAFARGLVGSPRTTSS